jgi:hypothetical protein
MVCSSNRDSAYLSSITLSYGGKLADAGEKVLRVEFEKCSSGLCGALAILEVFWV